VRPAAGAASGLDVLNRLDLEQYVAGVLAAEVVLWSAMPAELEAQAIAARSYAVAALEDRRRVHRDPWLLAGVRDQAYAGLLPEADRSLEGRLRAAVERTRGRVLVERGRVVDARFHAACGGATADGRSVFPEADFDCLRSVACEPCASERAAIWSTTAVPAALARAAESAGVGSRLTGLEPARRDPSGRWLEVELRGERGTRVVRFEELRGALGPDAVRSARVVRTWPHAGEAIEAGLYLEGRGRGHGVGLCQNGAHGYARMGWTSARILDHYYPGARVADAR
jgi:stage II sporulation protein D